MDIPVDEAVLDRVAKIPPQVRPPVAPVAVALLAGVPLGRLLLPPLQQLPERVWPVTVSQWCANPDGEECVLYEQLVDGGEWTETPLRVSGHDLCRTERWHDRSHVDCCAGDDEKESWACTCTCHEGGSGRRMT